MTEPLYLPLFPAPFRFVADCLACLVDPARDPRQVLEAARPGRLDWGAVAATIARHRIDAAVTQVLRAADWHGVPASLRTQLERAEESTVVRTLMQTAETDRIGAALHTHGIRFFVLKGVPLSCTLFGSATVRQSKDVDILVDPQDLDQAAAALVALGYARSESDAEHARTPRQQGALRAIRSDLSFRHSRTGTIVELHWRPRAEELLPFSMATAWPARRVERPHRVDLPVLPDDQLFVYLACHGAAHAWFRLKWLLDIAVLLARREPAEVGRLWEEARRDGLGAVIGSTLLLAHGLLGAPVAESILQAAARDTAARRLARFAAIAMMRDKAPEHSTLLLLNRFHMRSDWRYRRWVMATVLYAPQDWAALPLPDSLFPLYFLLRPLTWLKQRLR